VLLGTGPGKTGAFGNLGSTTLKLAWRALHDETDTSPIAVALIDFCRTCLSCPCLNSQLVLAIIEYSIP
jgi:hypothetical protein